jgi:hypothetical protein
MNKRKIFAITILSCCNLSTGQAQDMTKWGYDSLVAQYKTHLLPCPDMGKLALAAQKAGDLRLADSIAKDYRVNYLERQNDSILLNAQNLRFITRFPWLIKGGDRYFIFFYYRGREAERLAATRPDYARDIVRTVITNDEINLHIYKDGKVIDKNPPWKKIYRNVRQKYSKELADLLLPKAELHYFEVTGNWVKYAGIFEKEIHQHPPRTGAKIFGGMFDDVWELNVQAWNIFLHCTDKKVLRKGLEWSDLSIRLTNESKDGSNVQYLDTKANLLYKLGMSIDAIALEKHIVDDVCRTESEAHEYMVTLSKMKTGQPTWPTN